MAGITLWACVISVLAVVASACVAVASVLWMGRIAAQGLQDVTKMASETIESGRVFVAPVEYRSAWELEQERKRALSDRANLEAIS